MVILIYFVYYRSVEDKNKPKIKIYNETFN